MSDALKSEVEGIVEGGREIRDGVRRAVEAAARRVEAGPERLAELSRSTMEGAMAVVERAVPDDPESTLRQVVDGLTDGLERTANATRLALEEAAGEGRAYAGDELKRVAEDFRTLSGMFVETVEKGLAGAGHESAERLRGVGEHARRAFEAVRPSIAETVRTATHDPVGLAGESAAAAAHVTREAAGSLFAAVGRMLQSAGDRLKSPDAPSGGERRGS